MHAVLRAQIAERPVAGDGERHALDARLFARLLIEDLDGVAVPLAPTQVHAEQHLGPVLRVDAAGAGVDRDQRVLAIVVARQHAGTLNGLLAARHFDAWPRRPLGRRFVGGLFGQLQQDLRVVEEAALLFPGLGDVAPLGLLLEERLRAHLVVPWKSWAPTPRDRWPLHAQRDCADRRQRCPRRPCRACLRGSLIRSLVTNRIRYHIGGNSSIRRAAMKTQMPVEPNGT